jgi:hypothetical protein
MNEVWFWFVEKVCVGKQRAGEGIERKTLNVFGSWY